MANVNPKVKKLVLLIKCKPNQEKEIPISHLKRRIKYAKQKYLNADILIKIVNL